MIRSSYLLLCLALTASLPAGAGVYTYIDAQGNQVFTDQPRRGDARELQMAPPNQAVPTKVMPRPLLAPGQPPAPPEYDRLRILLPEPDSTLNDGTGNMLVTVTSEPGLRPGHLFRLLLDDQPQGAPSASPVTVGPSTCPWPGDPAACQAQTRYTNARSATASIPAAPLQSVADRP